MRPSRETTAMVAALVQASDARDGRRVDFAALRSLPEPVARYLRHVLRDGQPLIRTAHLSQAGVLRTDVRSRQWRPFQACQVIAPLARGFVWDARVRIAPLLRLHVRDAYVHGEGSGRVSLLSVLTLAAARGGVEMNTGSLHRYLAETVWCPTALLPDAGLRWSPVGPTAALATLADAGVSVSLEFRFNDADEVAGIYAAGRWGRFDGAYRLAPWEGHFRAYEERDGMRVPAEGEVGWYAAGRWECVFRGRLTGARYALAA